MEPTHIVVVVLSLFTIGTLIIAGFLSKELFKHYAVARRRTQRLLNAGQGEFYYYRNIPEQRPRMGVLVLESAVPFEVTIGCLVTVPLFKYIGLEDWVETVSYFGYARAKPYRSGEGQRYRVVIATWLGRRPVDFIFDYGRRHDVAVYQHSLDESAWTEKNGAVDARFPPHLHQRLGFYA